MILRIIAALFALAVCLRPPAAQAQTQGEIAAPAGHRIVLPADVAPDHYDIAITPNAQQLTFTGTVRVAITVHTATDKIVLNDANIVIDRASLAGATAAANVTYDAKAETVGLALDHPLQPGRYSLTLDYHGVIYKQASGLFALDYQSGGKPGRALFTQFENSDARRFVPCWDEPGRKASFTLTVVAPRGEMAVSNMPVAAITRLGGGLQRVRFAQTPKMSTYLLFLGLGDFERIHRKVGKVDVGVIVKRGDTADGQFALDAATRLLPYYNDYFGTPYPLPKLDLIAGPGSSAFFGAMENWGAIFAFESDFLVDPRVSTEADRQDAFVTIAHEMAHQWFGDLVTMSWWDDLWLNEGFATWMEKKATDHFHPEWKLWLQELNEKDDAMQSDGRDGAHPVITPIDNVLQADASFDNITYSKGAAVIRMLEADAGEAGFRAGVRRYIADHAYGNTTTDDLWRELDPASPGRPITAIAHAFTLQAGVPLIRETDAGCDDGLTALTLVQDRFMDDGGTASPTAWPVPVTAGVASAKRSKTVVTPAGAQLSLKGCGPGLINAGQAGYFRTLYHIDQRGVLIDAFPSLGADDQLGLINDFNALGDAGYQPASDFLALTRQARVNTDPIVWKRIADDLVALDRLYDGGPSQVRFRVYARGVLQPALTAVGWDARPGESDNTAIMRASILTTLASLDDPAAIAEARRRFAIFLTSPSSLAAATRKTVLSIVAEQAGAQDWQTLHKLALAAPTELERRDLYVLLGRAIDPALAQSAMALALSGEPATTVAPDILTAVSSRHADLALSFVAANWAKVSQTIEPNERPLYVPTLVRTSADPRMAAKLQAFAAANIPASDQGDVRKAVAGVDYRAKVKAERLPQIDRWLAEGN